MKTIHIGFSTSAKKMIGSDVIKWVINKPFSHTYFRFKEDMYSDETVNHATGHGINYMSYTRFLEHNRPVKEFTFNISDELYAELLTYCHQNAGVKYGYWQNLGIAAIRGLNKLGFKISKNPIDDGVNCSEWMYYILEELYGKWTDTDPNLVAPDEVYEYLMTKESI